MGKGARNRAIVGIAVAATVGKNATATKQIARRLRREALQARRRGGK